MTAVTPNYAVKDYKSDLKPIWCPGCGDYSVLSSLTKALAELQIAPENCAVVSGIGCSSRIPAYTNVYGFHGVHGRSLTAAAGLKLARPDLTVIVTGGDGDGFSIGGNHFLHACRRNVNMTYIVMDNQVYGMTKGQASPTTAPDWCSSKLTPEGTGVTALQPLQLALACGANFVARGFSGDPNHVAKLIVEAVNHPGFSFLQILSPCVTFRAEQRGWKEMVQKDKIAAATDNVAEALALLAEDAGVATGILYAGRRGAFQPSHNPSSDIDRIERKFVA